MAVQSLEKLFEHNTWANLKVIHACLGLSDEQLDAAPKSATRGSIRDTLVHLVTSQQGYLRLLTLPREERLEPIPTPPFAELGKLAASSGNALLALARDEARKLPKGHVQTRSGSSVEPWLVMVQVINHATEHREQIKSMLSALGMEPPEIDAWSYGETTNALIHAAEK